MASDLVWQLALLFALVAALYASVGHGGASAYLAIMALLHVEQAVARPTALVLNLFVAAIAWWQFTEGRRFPARLFASLAVSAIPMAYLGGQIHLPADWYRPAVGIILLVAAVQLLWRPRALVAREPGAPPWPVLVSVGAGMGFLAGLTGTGGGIFLSPLLILAAWASARETAGVAAAFIFVNSAAGLAGNLSSFGELPDALPLFVGAVIAGGAAGSWLSAKRLPRATMLRLLSVVMLIAGGKLIIG
jgi:uncharacterized membrane protein YfcA